MAYRLLLIPQQRQSQELFLREHLRVLDPLERLVKAQHHKRCVYAGVPYQLKLRSQRYSPLAKITLYVNEKAYPASLRDDSLELRSWNRSIRLFDDCYGFVRLRLDLRFSDGKQLSLYSEDLPVLVPKGPLNDSIKGMADYVNRMQGQLFPKAMAASLPSIRQQLDVAMDVLQAYRALWPILETKERRAEAKSHELVSATRGFSFDPKTVQFLLRHPQNLRSSSYFTGLRMGQAHLYPRQVPRQMEAGMDREDKRILLGFLAKMHAQLSQMEEEVLRLHGNLEADFLYHKDYHYSPFLLFSQTKEVLEDALQGIRRCQHHLLAIQDRYQALLMERVPALQSLPPQRKRFVHRPAFHRLWLSMGRWYQLKAYCLAKESAMLSVAMTSNLYEIYVLSKLMAGLLRQGFVLEKSYHEAYPVPAQYQEAEQLSDNVFIYQKEEERIALFYQPAIFNGAHPKNKDLGLYRNNSISLEQYELPYEEIFYRPDFVLKRSAKAGASYLILDAKFSNSKMVRTQYMAQLAYKYLFSISPLGPNDQVLGLGIIYGRCDEQDSRESFYDQQATHAIRPFAELIPLMEDLDDFSRDDALDGFLAQLTEA